MNINDINKSFSECLGKDTDNELLSVLNKCGIVPADRYRKFLKSINIKPENKKDCILFISKITCEISLYANQDKILNKLENFFKNYDNMIDDICYQFEYKFDFFALILRIFNYSEYLSNVLSKDKDYLKWLYLNIDSLSAKSYEKYYDEAKAIFDVSDCINTKKNKLCRFRDRELLRIGARDLYESTDLKIITSELSNLALSIIQVSYEICFENAVLTFGIPAFFDDKNNIHRCKFTIMSMGKLGGGELNFSSDIDVVFVYEEEGKTISPDNLSVNDLYFIRINPNLKIKEISNHEFFTILGENIIKFISEPVAEGKLFRIDLRLRPEGVTGPLVRSFESYTAYLYSQSRPWEKLVYLKTNFAAGDKILYENFKEILDEFIYINTDIPSIIKEIAHLKSRIDNEILNSEKKIMEVKRGVGGIREIEFTVYLLQIIYGTSKNELKTQSIYYALDKLKFYNLLLPEEYDILMNGYYFLRKIEHQLQMIDERQNHLLPDSRDELNLIGERFGFKKINKKEPADLFLEKYKNTTYKVHSIFTKYFNINKEDNHDYVININILLDENSSAQQCFDILKNFRFKEPAIEKCFKRLGLGTSEYYLSTNGQKFFEKILPVLLEYSSQTPFPDQAVRNFDNFLESSKGITSYYSVIAENPGILKLLLRIFGSSNYLSRILIAHPEYFDEIVDPGMIEIRTYPSEDLIRFLNRTANSKNHESAFNNLRKRRRLELLKIGIRDVLALFSSSDLSKQMTSLAEGCLNTALNILKNHYFAIYGEPKDEKTNEGSKFCIAGLGGFGSNELNYFSDLDVIYFYEGDGETSGDDRISNYKFWTLLVEELSKKFSEITPEDLLYKLDARLRPEGKSAPILISSSRLIDYYANIAEIWEALAFLRFRPVAGDIDFGARIKDEIIERIVKKFAERLPLKMIRDMRERIEKSVNLPQSAYADLKKSKGGIFDIEFIVHIYQFLFSQKYPELLTQNTADILNILLKFSIIDKDEYIKLYDGFQFYRKLQSKIRLLFESASNYIPISEKMESLEVAFAFMPNQKPFILDMFKKYSKDIREIFTKIIENEIT